MPYTILPGNIIDASQYGVTPGTDCTTAFQSLVDNAPNGSWLQLPAGVIQVSATIDFTSANRIGLDAKNTSVRLLGCGRGVTTVLPSVKGGFAGPLIGRNTGLVTGSGSVHIEGISFSNGHALGKGIWVEALTDDSKIEDCDFSAGYVGLDVGSAGAVANGFVNTGVKISDCGFSGLGIGCQFWGQGEINSCRATACTNGFMISSAVRMLDNELEVCGIGILAGAALNAGGAAQWIGVICGVDTEACLHHVVFEKGTLNAVLESAFVYGDPQHPAGGPPTVWPTSGVECRPGSGRVFLIGCEVGGSFTDEAILAAGNGPLVLLSSAYGIKDNGQGGAQIPLNNTSGCTVLIQP